MNSNPLAIRQVTHAADIALARALFVEYAAWLDIDLRFQGFSEELAALPGGYAPPAGRLFVIGEASDVAVADVAGPNVAEPNVTEPVSAGGCVALRRLAYDASGQSCELKRLWVRPQFRGRGAGRLLTEAAIGAAREIGYASMKLDTLSSIMPEAVTMYRKMGFTDCAPYYHNPVPGTLYLERAL